MTAFNNTSQLFDKHKEDFTYCEEIIKKHSKTFYAAFSTLPKEKAQSVYAIYAFCRRADDIVDEEADLAGLQQLETDLRVFEKGGEIDHPVWRALRVVFSTYKIDIAPFYDMIEGQKRDLNFKQPRTQEELEEYSYYVAGSVGLMLLPLLTDEPEKIQAEAIALGTAMQLTNILRDIGEDQANGRIYLPREVMQESAYTEAMLNKHIINQAFIDLWEYEAQEAENLYQAAFDMLPYIHPDSKRPLVLSLLMYRAILDAVRSNDYQCFTQRNKVSAKKKMEVFLTAKNMLK